MKFARLYYNITMGEVLGKSFLTTLFAILAMYGVRQIISTDIFVADISRLLGSLTTTIGTLYGIMSAFIVFEVWNKYNRTSGLINQEALGLEELSNLTLYFRDEKLSQKMNEAIKKYASLVVELKFKALVGGERQTKIEKAFDKIGDIVRNIKFNDDHDAIVFDHVILQYKQLSEIRSQRISQNVTHLPPLLKVFLYVASIILIGSYIAVPFTNIIYNAIAIGALGFIVSMIIQMVEDLDDPTSGHWSLSSAPFKKVADQIRTD